MISDYDNGSGALAYLRLDLFGRPEIHAPILNWTVPRPASNNIAVSTSITFAVQSARYLTTGEQRVFDAALRRSVKIVSRGNPRESSPQQARRG
jgi:hypothetical protein